MIYFKIMEKKMRLNFSYLTIMLIIFSIVTSCHDNENQNSVNNAKKMTKKDEIIKIMRDNWISLAEEEQKDYFDYFTYEHAAQMLKELEKIKKDYFYEPDPNLFI